MMALGSDPRAVALRVHLLFVFAGAVALGVGSVVLLIAAGVWPGAGGAGGPRLFLPAPLGCFLAGGGRFGGVEGLRPGAQKGERTRIGPHNKAPVGFAAPAGVGR